MYDVSQLLPRSPQSTRSRVNSAPTHRSPLHLLSPSKSHATPSRTRQISPRKSPAKKGLFESMSSHAVHFTPEKTRQPPRAWERRPATPYVPRDDKQKIWKRVPLGEIGIEPNRPVTISRKEQEATKDYVRVVKKLKVGHGSDDDEDKENVSLEAKTDFEDGEPKRRPHFDSRFISMKMEQDDIVGSPKKKLRPLTDECVPTTTDNALEESEGQLEAAGDEGLYEEDSGEPFQQDTFEEQAARNGQETPVTEEDNIENALLAADIIDVSPRLNACTVDSTSSNSRSDASQREQETSDTHRPGESSVSPAADDAAATMAAGIDTMPTRDSPRKTSAVLETESPHAPTKQEQEMPPQLTEHEAYLPTSASKEQQSDEMEVDNMEDAIALEEPRSSSPPTILAENVVIDELESRNASKADASTSEQNRSPDDRQEEGTSSREVQELAPRRISDDEAAFLRNFVSNSKAERAAREKKAQDTVSHEAPVQPEEPIDDQNELHESFEEAPHITEGTPTLEPSVTASAENVTNSPLRRSKRAAITSIPRPQILPNAIQLKRANGNEFIFTANKASSVANIAVVTRSNTKRNKGSAFSVPERLEQLLANENDVSENGETAQELEGESETSHKENTNKTFTTKKRKRDAKDGTARAKKVLRWNDEKLVSYQEAKKFLDEPEDIDDSSQENTSTHEHETTESDKHVKLTLTLSAGGSGSTSSKDDKDISATPQSKVRRVRRGTSGTVNGTPGPKTRSRRITNDEDKDLNTDIPIDDNGSLEDSTAAAAAISELAATAEATKNTAGTKRSRMPMPVMSSLGTRRGAAASASIRSGSAAMRAAAVVPAESKKNKEVNKSQSVKDDAKGDPLGKRRLRVRS